MRLLFKEQKYAWFLLAFLWVFGFVGSLGRFVMAYYQKDISETLGVGRSFLGATWSTAIFIGAISAPLGGWLIDKIGYKKVMIYSAIANLLSLAIVLLFRNPVGYFLGFGLITGIAGIGASASYVLVANWFKHHRAKALMIIGSAGSLGLAVLTPILVSNKSWLSWTTVYTVLFIISLAFIPLILLIVRANKEAAEEEAPAASVQDTSSPTNKEPGEEQPPAPAEPVFSLKKMSEGFKAFLLYLTRPVMLVIMFALLTCGISMGTVEMNLMAIHQLAHVPDVMMSSSLSLLGLLELVGGVTFSILLDYMPRVKALAYLYFFRIAAFAVLFFHFEYSPILFSLIFGATYLGAVPGGILVAGEALNEGKKQIGLQTGILLLIHQLGGVVAAIAGGLNFDLANNYQFLIAANAVFSLIAAAGYFVLHRRGIGAKKAPVLTGEVGA